MRRMQRTPPEGIFDMDKLDAVPETAVRKQYRLTTLDANSRPILRRGVPLHADSDGRLLPAHEAVAYLALRDYGYCHLQAARVVNIWRQEGVKARDLTNTIGVWVRERQSSQQRVEASILLSPIGASEFDRFMWCAVFWRRLKDDRRQAMTWATFCTNSSCCQDASQYLHTFWQGERPGLEV